MINSTQTTCHTPRYDRPVALFADVMGIALASLLLFGVTACDATKEVHDTGGAEASVVTSPNDQRRYDLIALENGLEVMLVSDPTVEKSAAALSVGVGAASDPENYPGMAHYLEHMLFMGSSQYPEPDGFMAFTAEHGGMSNAYTGLDITNYMMLVENEAFPEALDRFSRFFTDPLLDPTYIDKEKNAVNAEWSMRREQDFRITYRLARKLLGDHPANRFQIGNLESLADKTEAGLHAATVAFFEAYYSANLMKASLIGNRSIAELRALAEAHFADIPNQQIAKPEITAPLDFAEVGAKRVRYVPKDDTRELRLDFIIDNNRERDDAKPSEYLSYILGSEMPGTPAVRLRELGWASALVVSADPSRYGNYGVFTFSVRLTPEGLAHRKEITGMLLGYLAMLQAQGVDDRYADEFGTSLNNRFRFLEKMDDFSYAHELTRAMQTHPAQHAIAAPYRFTGFDQQAVDAVLAQLIPERLHVWEIDQQQTANEALYFYDGHYAVEELALPDSTALREEALAYQLSLPAKNQLLPEQFAIAETSRRPEQVWEASDISVWLQGSEAFAALPRGYTQIYLNTPYRQQSVDAAVMLLLWSDLYNLAQTALINEAAIAGMGLSLALDEGLRLSLSGFTDKQPKLLSAALAGLNVNPDEQALQQAIDRLLRGLDNRKRALPVSQLGRVLASLTQTGYYDEASVRRAATEVTLDNFNGFVEAVLDSALVRVYLFGNYDKAYAENTVATIRAVLPAERAIAAPYTRGAVYAPTAGQSVVYNADLPVEDLGMMLLYASPAPTVTNEANGLVLARHLRNRAFDTLRTEEQLGYAAGGLTTTMQDHPWIGFYIQTPVKAPTAMLERFEQFSLDYAAMLEALTKDQFENLKSGVLTQLTEPPTNLSDEAGPFLADWIREQYDFSSRQQLIAAVEAVTLTSIREYYQKTVLADDPSRILIQLRGQRWQDQPYAELEGATLIDNVEAFHEGMPRQALSNELNE
jgi:protease-3